MVLKLYRGGGVKFRREILISESVYYKSKQRVEIPNWKYLILHIQYTV